MEEHVESDNRSGGYGRVIRFFTDYGRDHPLWEIGTDKYAMDRVPGVANSRSDPQPSAGGAPHKLTGVSHLFNPPHCTDLLAAIIIARSQFPNRQVAVYTQPCS